ncbi:RICIN domain-containing protein [Streptomyces sp. NRRL S-237]|uniref:RICIN domain-containing protein n=1 Tax=Streptomyces sp. NRRL S-237 TaxID=1463895 RepID=UPI00068C7921|nr:RICIN domain-containing protein [Streptomyces sp. NRRL S-237]
MSRIVRSVLAVGASVAALVGGVSAAVAEESPAAPASVTAPSAATAVTSAAAGPSTVQLRAEHSGQCLTLPKASLRNGVNAVQSACADGAENQWFDLAATGAGTFELRAGHSGKCLDVEGAAITSGTPVQQWWCVGAPQQRWRLVMVDIAKELYELRPTHTAPTTDRCLGIASASKDDGASAQLGMCSGTAAQKWRLQPVTAA